MNITKAEFIISVANGRAVPDYGAPEIAVAGKSNVGKSSFINFITNNSKLARTSSDPGRTRLLNFFKINGGEFYLVDLPGYGYAKVSKTEQASWGGMIEGYLATGANLRHVLVLVDIRHAPGENDKILLNYLYHYNIPFTVIATKADKLSRSAQNKCRADIANALGVGVSNVLVTSSSAKLGRDEVLQRFQQILSE